MIMADDKQLGPGAATVLPEVLAKIERAINDTRHGSVTLIVQDSRIIQIDKLEKIRLG